MEGMRKNRDTVAVKIDKDECSGSAEYPREVYANLIVATVNGDSNF